MATTDKVMSDVEARARAFVAEWRDEPGREKQQGQQFVRALFAVYGVLDRRVTLFEETATKASTGRGGYIDALYPGVVAIEMKSKGEDLVKAESQAIDYLGSLPDVMFPRWVVSCDFAKFRIKDMESPDTPSVEFLLDGPQGFVAQHSLLNFLAGGRTFGSAEQEAASIKAARLMADLYGSLESTGYDDHQASVFLVRVLFCLYADDAGVWDRNLFHRFLHTRTSNDGKDLGAMLATLFDRLDQRPEDRQRLSDDDLIGQFPYVNGGLFADPVRIPVFDSEMRAKLVRACEFNWAGISPAVFGSMFQAVKSKDARRELGEHYTTETNILKTLKPLFLDALHDRLADNFSSTKGLRALLSDLASVRVLDPACGCGNFLVVAYRELRQLELDILVRLRALGDPGVREGLFFTGGHLNVQLSNFAGIEIEDWPARIAQTALHLVDHQANQQMSSVLGDAPPSLPLGTITTIKVGNALREDWAALMPPTRTVYVVGNPPFLGDHTREKAQLDDLKAVWGDRTLSRLDYVTGWYKKALDYFGTIPGEFAFVSTNSITQGDQAPRLFSEVFGRGWQIRFAHRTFTWTSEAPNAAAVHCVIVGLSRSPKTRRLFSYATPRGVPTEVPADFINAYLIDGPNVLIPKRSQPLTQALPKVSYGSKPSDGGHLVVTPAQRPIVNADPAAAKYLRRYIGSDELINGLDRWCLWLVDVEPADIKASPILRARIEAVQHFRSTSTAATTRDYPHNHMFRQLGITADQPIVCIPEVSSENRRYLPVGHLDGGAIISNKVYGAPDPDGLIFAVASSSMFITWMKAVGGRMKSDLSFSSTITYNNFPMPEPTDKQRAAIIAAGKAVLDARTLNPNRSLADHYNPLAMDPHLVSAHRDLDRAVDPLFSKTRMASERDRQRALFNAYVRLASNEALIPTPRPRQSTRSQKVRPRPAE